MNMQLQYDILIWLYHLFIYCELRLNETGEPLSAKQCDKQKAFENIAAGLRVDEHGNATWNGKTEPSFLSLSCMKCMPQRNSFKIYIASLFVILYSLPLVLAILCAHVSSFPSGISGTKLVTLSGEVCTAPTIRDGSIR